MSDEDADAGGTMSANTATKPVFHRRGGPMTAAFTDGAAAGTTPAAAPSARVVVADDHALVREGLVRVLERGGFAVMGAAATADGLLGQARAHQPDVVVTDIQMPAGNGRDGMWAALELRRSNPEIAVVVLSQNLEADFAFDLLEAGASGVGYMLKEKIANPELFVDAVRTVAAGGSVLDPDVVSCLVRRGRVSGPLEELTPREREVLVLMAEGRSNTGIAAGLFITVPAVERHVTGIFTKLGLQHTDTDQHRRVLAVLAYLQAEA
ncbi:response regulator [Streptomyces sp. NPDC001530]|uniref:response regulator transcription factor n=1 Tax=Streptomyces sp. NPDC001530 TaxID=3364582 RepID=UPI00367BADCC